MTSSVGAEKRVLLELHRSISNSHSNDTVALEDSEKQLLYSKYLLVGKYGASEGVLKDRLAWMHSEPIRLECHKAAMALRVQEQSRYDGCVCMLYLLNVYVDMTWCHVCVGRIREKGLPYSSLVLNEWSKAYSRIQAGWMGRSLWHVRQAAS